MIYIGRVITQSIIYIITIIMVPEEQEKKTLIIIKLIKKLELLKCDINSRFRTVQCFINNLITMRKCRIPAIKKKKNPHSRLESFCIHIMRLLLLLLLLIIIIPLIMLTVKPRSYLSTDPNVSLIDNSGTWIAYPGLILAATVGLS